jgi:hypothetical protein
LTGFNSSGSWPPTLLAISQTMNQINVIATATVRYESRSLHQDCLTLE